MPDQLQFPLRLTIDEIAYLLATIKASEIPGLALPDLFPEESDARHEQLQRGYQALLEHGLIQEIRQNDVTFMDLNSYLVEYIAALAYPEALLRVTLALHETREAKAFIIALGRENLVEAARTLDGIVIQARPLPTLSAMLEDLGRLFQIPAQTPSTLRAVLSPEHMRTLEQGGRIEPSMVDPAVANGLAETFAKLKTQGVLSISSVPQEGWGETSGEDLGILVGGESRVWAWLLHSDRSNNHSQTSLYVHTCNLNQFCQELTTRIQQVYPQAFVRQPST